LELTSKNTVISVLGAAIFGLWLPATSDSIQSCILLFFSRKKHPQRTSARGVLGRWRNADEEEEKFFFLQSYFMDSLRNINKIEAREQFNSIAYTRANT
jgi:hypothetical protein